MTIGELGEVVMKWAGKKSDWIIQEMWSCFRSLRHRLTFAPILIMLGDGGVMCSTKVF